MDRPPVDWQRVPDDNISRPEPEEEPRPRRPWLLLRRLWPKKKLDTGS